MRELIVKSQGKGTEIALLEEGILTELHYEHENTRFVVGDILLAKVKRILPSLNAAFIDLGKEEGFLHYTDLGTQVRSLNNFVKAALSTQQTTHLLADFNIEPYTEKNGKIGDLLQKGQPLVVQIIKEPIANKGARLSTEISFAGRYLVLIPFSKEISVSQKIESKEERKRLERLAKSICPRNFGMIIRTAAESKSVADLHADLHELLGKWEQVYKGILSDTPPAKLLGELDKASAILRDLLNASFHRVAVDDARLSAEIRTYISRIAPGKESIVQHYSGKKPIFDHFAVNKNIKASFGKHVNLNGGAYIIIEHTEAMHVIDVNSGYKVSTSTDLDNNALSVNLLAAAEIVRQIRLRDLGGIITIDFIDMKSNENRKKVYDTMVELMKNDRAKHTILPLSKFCLMQITRQRVRPELQITNTETCPHCNGSGVAQPSLLLIDHVYEDLSYLFKELNYKELKIKVHPFVESHLQRGWWSLRYQWMWEFKKRINISSDAALSLMDYHIYNKEGEEIEL